MKILSVFGTRPEAIKMAPLVHFLANDERFEAKVCVTAQHREMLDQVLEIFDIQPDFDLNLMKKGQTLNGLTADILTAMPHIYEQFRPDIVLVHGDTGTTFATAMSAYYEQIHIGHVEAGLRTGNIYSPWPEEANRKLTSALAELHFAPTDQSAQNLYDENIDRNRVHITGNTVVDALFMARDVIEKKSDKSVSHNKFWKLKNTLPGFKEVDQISQRIPGLNILSHQLVYSDGLAYVSLFIRPVAKDKRPKVGEVRIGSTNISARYYNGYQIMSVGSVPFSTVKHFSESVVF